MNKENLIDYMCARISRVSTNKKKKYSKKHVLFILEKILDHIKSLEDENERGTSS